MALKKTKKPQKMDFWPLWRGKKLQMASKLINKGQFWAHSTAKLWNSVAGCKWDKNHFIFGLGYPKMGQITQKKNRVWDKKKRMNQILYEGWIFFQNHRVVMHVGAGLHMSHARQNLGTLGGFETSLHSKNDFLGQKKYIWAPKVNM